MKTLATTLAVVATLFWAGVALAANSPMTDGNYTATGQTGSFAVQISGSGAKADIGGVIVRLELPVPRGTPLS